MVQEYIGGVDVGGTWIRVAICTKDLNEDIIKKKKTRTVKETKFSIGNLICELLSELLQENLIEKNQLIGIGVASAGPLNIETGTVFNISKFGFKEISLREQIEQEFPGIPLYFINDGSGAVLGVHYFEAEKEEIENIVYITLSTGIGGGVICNGHLLVGKEGNAVEIGHGSIVSNSNIKCNCGGIGCWEAFSSGSGVKSRVLDALEKGNINADKLLEIVKGDISKINAKEIFQAARKGDILSTKVVDDCVFYTKVGVGLINNFYDCSTIYFGGAMMRDKDQILPHIIKQFEDEPLIFTINRPPKIKATRYEDEIGLMGALTLVKYKLEQNDVIF
ncbi:MAG: ROK family protein [Candidatus Thorarchaeota archaeon]